MVIQRWQSVLLLLAGIIMACFTFMSLGQVQLENYSLDFTTLGFKIEGIQTDGAPTGFLEHTWSLFIISLMCVIIPVFGIFLFKNLPLQKRVCLVEVMFIIAATAACALIGYRSFPGHSVSWSSMIISPVLSLIAVIMAYRCINRDHNMLKSVDRIR